MKKQLLKEIIEKKERKVEFAIITNLENGESCVFEKEKPIDKNFEKHKEKIISQFDKKKNGIIEGTNIFVDTYIRPIKVIIVGINKWPKEAFAEIKTDQNTALIALTHDPKIDDPALQHALKNNFFYIGALGSKKTHANRCGRLREAGFNDEQINKIFGPIGIKLGGRSAPEIALSIIAQLVSEIYNK